MDHKIYTDWLNRHYETTKCADARPHREQTKAVLSNPDCGLVIVKEKPRKRYCKNCEEIVDFNPVIQIQKTKKGWSQKCSSPCLKHLNNRTGEWKKKYSVAYIPVSERAIAATTLLPGQYIDPIGRIKSLKLPVEAIKDIMKKEVPQVEYAMMYDTSQGFISMLQNGKLHAGYNFLDDPPP